MNAVVVSSSKDLRRCALDHRASRQHLLGCSTCLRSCSCPRAPRRPGDRSQDPLRACSVHFLQLAVQILALGLDVCGSRPLLPDSSASWCIPGLDVVSWYLPSYLGDDVSLTDVALHHHPRLIHGDGLGESLTLDHLRSRTARVLTRSSIGGLDLLGQVLTLAVDLASWDFDDVFIKLIVHI